MKKGLVFEIPFKIVPPRPEQVFLKHPRNSSGKSLSPALKSEFLIFWASGVFPSTSGAVVANRDAINVTLLFWYSAFMSKAQKSWIYNVLCQTIYFESRNSGLDG